jgi:riboflavin-specific deaminase-like protein
MEMAITELRRPFVTLTYAQSIDGSIAARPGVPCALSGAESKRFTHQLRANHDAILVGIGTVLADDPQLNVRLVSGNNPRPIILDSLLRCPTTARCIDSARRIIIAASQDAPMVRQRELETVGAVVVRLPARDGAIDLPALLDRLGEEGIQTVMVEGGARVITSFLRARLVNRLIVTIAPTIIGGVRGVNELVAEMHFPRLRDATMQRLGEDWILTGDLDG